MIGQRGRRSLVAIAVAVFTLAGSAGASTEHLPAAAGTRGEPLAVVVSATADAPWVRGRVHFMAYGAREYQSVRLVRDYPGHFSGSIPNLATTGLVARYYVELSADGHEPLLLGAPASPFTVSLFDPVHEPARPTRELSAAMVVMVFVGGPIVLLRRWRRSREELDKGFWRAHLKPLAALEGNAVNLEVARLCRRPLYHPVHGRRRFKVEEVHAKLLMFTARRARS